MLRRGRLGQTQLVADGGSRPPRRRPRRHRSPPGSGAVRARRARPGRASSGRLGRLAAVEGARGRARRRGRSPGPLRRRCRPAAQPSAQPVEKARPSSDSDQASACAGSTSGAPARWWPSPSSPRSQPTPVAPGPNWVQKSLSVCWVWRSSSRVPSVDLGQLHGQPAGGTHELPGHREQPRWLAGLDLAAGVALDLIAPAQLEIAADGSEPARQPLGRGQGVPDVVDRRPAYVRPAVTTRAGMPFTWVGTTRRSVARTRARGSLVVSMSTTILRVTYISQRQITSQSPDRLTARLRGPPRPSGPSRRRVCRICQSMSRAANRPSATMIAGSPGRRGLTSAVKSMPVTRAAASMIWRTDSPSPLPRL